MELTMSIPKVEQMNGIQSTNVTWTTLALTVLEYTAASNMDQNPTAKRAPACRYQLCVIFRLWKAKQLRIEAKKVSGLVHLWCGCELEVLVEAIDM